MCTWTTTGQADRLFGRHLVPFMACETLVGAVLQTYQWALAALGGLEGLARAGSGQQWPVAGGLLTATGVLMPPRGVYRPARRIDVAAQALKGAPSQA